VARFNVVIISPDGFIHSGAFLELAELINHSLLSLGHESEVTFRTLRANTRPILLNFHTIERYEALFSRLPPDTVVVNTEHLWSEESPPHFAVRAIDFEVSRRIVQWAKFFECWDIGLQNIGFLERRGAKKVKHLRLGWHSSLSRLNPLNIRPIDVLFYGSISERRRVVLELLARQGLRVKHLFGVYGAERDAFLAQSKIVLNLSYYPLHLFESVRVFYPVSNGVLTLCENSADVEPHFLGAAYFAYYGQLVETASRLVRSGDWKALGPSGLEGFMAHKADSFIHELLDPLETP